MNSKILVPKVNYGAFEVKNLTGGEIDWDKIIPSNAESCPVEILYKLSSHKLREEMDRCKEELRELPQKYSIINGVLKRDKNSEEKSLTLRERLHVGYIILNRRSYKRVKKVKTFEKGIYEVTETSPMNRGIFKDYLYEVKKGDKMVENKVHYEKNEDGEVIKYKDCIVPYTREGTLKVKDFLILHRCGRLGIKLPSGNIAISLGYVTGDEDSLFYKFKELLKKGNEFVVILPNGGFKKKEYGDIPMPQTTPREKRYSMIHNRAVQIEKIIRKVYKPEIDGFTQDAKDILYEYRGPTEGYAPVYTYDTDEHMRDFAPNILSYNQVEYGEKSIIILGIKESIKKIDGRIRDGNKIKNGYHKFTNEKVIPYKGQNSRCENMRLIPIDKGVQVFGLNLRNTPEEDLKGYLRSFDRVFDKRNNEEVKELLEITKEIDGRQTLLNMEYDLRHELKHLRTRTSKELYFLHLGVEEEIYGLPNKKEQALLNVLQSFKSSKEIEETEGKGLTNDIEDLVTIENNADDSRYKKSKNLFNQKEGMLLRNQNPLRMEGGFELLEKKGWSIKGGPISFPRNETLPKRNIPFVQRNLPKRLPWRLEGMFLRGGFYYKNITEKVKTEKGIISKEVGIKVERDSLSYPLYEYEPNLFIFLEQEFSKYERLSRRKSKPLIDIRRAVIFLERNFSDYEKKSKKFWEEKVIEDMRISTPKPRVPTKVSGFKVELPEELSGSFKKQKPLEQYLKNKRAVSTVRLFDNRNNPGPVMKECNYDQFVASEQQAYQFSGKLVFDEERHEFVRIYPHKTPSSFEILHTFGDGKGNVDYYIIKINGQILYAKGNVSLLNKELLSFTGGRSPSPKTKAFIKAFIDELYLEEDYVTVSGGAKGCDTIVHTRTIHNEGNTILVLAGGFNGQYTQKGQIRPEVVLKAGGLLLSEHPPEYVPCPKDFVLRNKIIASLSNKLVVFEGGKGTKHCAKFGVELGKELLVQQNINNQIKLVSRRDYPF